MVIHIVGPGDTVYALAVRYGVPMSRILEDNGLTPGETLVVGQALAVRVPSLTHTVRSGDTLWALSRRYGVPLRQLWRNNIALEGGDLLFPGQSLVIRYRGQEDRAPLSVLGYAYPWIGRDRLRTLAPFLTLAAPFTHRVTTEGGLEPLDDAPLLPLIRGGGAAPLLHLANLTDEGFSGGLVHPLLNSEALQAGLLDRIDAELDLKEYRGVDVDFEGVLPEDAAALPRFLRRLRARLAPRGLPLLAAVPPKVSGNQAGALVGGYDYPLLGEAADGLLLMTYEWGYAAGPPMAVAPLDQVRRVAQYAASVIPREKLWLGVPAYGYDWPLPFVAGETRARSLSPAEAVALAREHGAEISFDGTAQSPYFRYRDGEGRQHEVWFEDARSIAAKLDLVEEFSFTGVGVWEIGRSFPQLWTVLDARREIRDPV